MSVCLSVCVCVCVQVFFSELRYVYIESEPGYPALALLCDIGGTLGLKRYTWFRYTWPRLVHLASSGRYTWPHSGLHSTHVLWTCRLPFDTCRHVRQGARVHCHATITSSHHHITWRKQTQRPLYLRNTSVRRRILRRHCTAPHRTARHGTARHWWVLELASLSLDYSSNCSMISTARARLTTHTCSLDTMTHSHPNIPSLPHPREACKILRWVCLFVSLLTPRPNFT